MKRLKSFILVICLSNFMYSFFGYIYGSSTMGRFEIYGDMFDPNDIAYVLNSLFPLSLFYLLFNEGLLKRILSIVVICSSVFVILLTGSRGGLLGLASILLILVLTRLADIKRSKKILLLGFIGVSYFLLIDKINIERYLTLADIGSDYNISDEFGRMEIWKKGIIMMLDNPITGVGVDCFSMALGYMRESLGLLPKWQVAHNSFVQIGAEIGLIGFVVFILINLRCLMTFLHTAKIEATTKEAYEIKMLGSLMLIGFTSHLICAYFLTQAYSIYFVLYFVLAAVIRRLQAKLPYIKI